MRKFYETPDYQVDRFSIEEVLTKVSGGIEYGDNQGTLDDLFGALADSDAAETYVENYDENGLIY